MNESARLSPFALALTAGVLKAICLLGMAWVAYFFGYGGAIVEQVAHYYHGYEASFVGGIIGGVYGLVMGFIWGYIFAYVYNFFLRRCCGKSA